METRLIPRRHSLTLPRGPRKTPCGAGGLDSHRYFGLFRGFGFAPFCGRVSSLQPPVSPDGDDVASRWACDSDRAYLGFSRGLIKIP